MDVLGDEPWRLEDASAPANAVASCGLPVPCPGLGKAYDSGSTVALSSGSATEQKRAPCDKAGQLAVLGQCSTIFPDPPWAAISAVEFVYGVGSWSRWQWTYQ